MHIRSMILASVVSMALATSAFAETTCQGTLVLVDNNTDAATYGCPSTAMNGVKFIDVSMSNDCLATSLAPVNPAQHVELGSRPFAVDPVTGVKVETGARIC